jgi:hypothetical protein
MSPISYEQMSTIAIAFQRFENDAPGVTANLAHFLGQMALAGSSVELSGSSNLGHHELLHVRVPKYIGTVANKNNKTNPTEGYSPFLFFDHNTSNKGNRASIDNPGAFEAYSDYLIGRFGSENPKSVSLVVLLKNRRTWMNAINTYLAAPVASVLIAV